MRTHVIHRIVEIFDRIEQRIKVRAVKLLDLNQNPISGSKPNVGTANGRPITFEIDSAWLRNLGLIAKRDQLSLNEGFKSKRTRGS